MSTSSLIWSPLFWLLLFFFTGIQEENRGSQERVPKSIGRVPSQSGFQGNAHDTQTPDNSDDGLDGKSLLMGWGGVGVFSLGWDCGGYWRGFLGGIFMQKEKNIFGAIPDFHRMQMGLPIVTRCYSIWLGDGVTQWEQICVENNCSFMCHERKRADLLSWGSVEMWWTINTSLNDLSLKKL